MPAKPTIYRKGLVRACGLNDKTFGEWLRRFGPNAAKVEDRLIASDDDIAGQEGGVWRQFSLETSMQVCIAAALSRGGIPIATGLRTGFRFAFMRPPYELDFKPESGRWHLHEDLEARTPPMPFREGRTWLFQRPDGEFRFVRVRDDLSPRFNDVLLCFEDGLEGGAFVLEINPIYEKVARVFGLEPQGYRAAPALA